MRKVYLFMMISLDGFFEGPNHELDWHNADNDEFLDFAVEQLDATDTLVFGRRTYDMMAEFWPSDYALKTDPETAKRMNSYRKIVFSHNLQKAGWENTTVYNDDVRGVMTKLQEGQGKDIAVLGSSNLCLTLLQRGVLDEVRLMVNPLVLGKGHTLFAGLDKQIDFTLTNTRRFDSGNVLLTYAVDK